MESIYAQKSDEENHLIVQYSVPQVFLAGRCGCGEIGSELTIYTQGVQGEREHIPLQPRRLSDAAFGNPRIARDDAAIRQVASISHLGH